MNWLNFFDTKTPCQITLGRGINAQISQEEEELFNKSYEAFENDQVLDAYEFFLNSLMNYTDGVSNENIVIERDAEKLSFIIYQGCAKINGLITKEHLYAEVSIVKHKNSSVALKRYILERNYQLTYADYFSDGDSIKLKLYLDNITLSPQKIFFPLRELALNSDFDKEHIISEFSDIPLEEIEHVVQLDEKELKIKYDFLRQWIDELNEKVLKLPTNDNNGMQSFLYLNILFQIDYMLVPKYKMYRKLSKKLQGYFSDEHTTIESKNDELRKYLLELQELDFEEFKHNFYNAKYTFNPNEKSSYDEFVNFITESLLKVRWYKNNRYAQIIPTIYKYIAFNSLYNYGLHPVVRELLQILVKVQNSSYFDSLGCVSLYDNEKKTFAKRTIISMIQNAISTHEKHFKALEIETDELNFNSMNEFSNSFYTILKNLDMEEV